jgi:hypothetical protein
MALAKLPSAAALASDNNIVTTVTVTRLLINITENLRSMVAQRKHSRIMEQANNFPPQVNISKSMVGLLQMKLYMLTNCEVSRLNADCRKPDVLELSLRVLPSIQLISEGYAI